MKRNVIIAIIIGACASYLPIWEWGGLFGQVVGAADLAILALMLLIKTEPDTRKRTLTPGS